jgi:hypothetical protein
MSCYYKNTLKAKFGRKITAEEANEQFNAIEKAMACLEALVDDSTSEDEENHNYGSVNTETILDPAFGNLQFLTVEGDISLEFITPGENDPKVIYLVIADGGEGTFKFSNGAVWTTNSNGEAIDGVPWNSQGLGGFYGSIVICIHDGIGWVYLVFARNDIDFEATAETEDLYNWR